MPTEETPEERRARLRKILAGLKREERDARLRAGKGSPRTHREMRIFGADLLGKDVDENGDERPNGRATP